MKKSSKILETVQLGLFDLNKEEFDQYKNKVNRYLHQIYPQKINIDGMIFVATQKFDEQTRIKSIINYANTNITLIKSLVKIFSIESTAELFNVIDENYKDLFLPNGQYFENTLRILRRTEQIGVENELLAAMFLQNVIKQKLGIDVEVKRTNTDSKEDLIEGIDLFFSISGERYTCQVKPLKSMTPDTKTMAQPVNYTIKSSGRIKEYNVNYWVFIDRTNQKYAVFRNKKVTISYETVTFDKSSFVSSNY